MKTTLPQEYEYPLRVGRKTKKAVLDNKGKEVVVFKENNGLAELFCQCINREFEKRRNINKE